LGRRLTWLSAHPAAVHSLLLPPHPTQHSTLETSFFLQTGLSAHLVEIIALILLPVAISMCGYAIFIFKWRSDMIAKKRVSVTCCVS
jgi:hypothetical protein